MSGASSPGRAYPRGCGPATVRLVAAPDRVRRYCLAEAKRLHDPHTILTRRHGLCW
ncbi:hypothetical protein ACIHCQ_35010 [Streptomyces sp. NPDC052236]|uniref:hypothetical protein n=1 Tax=Streptomyces sp. NPDC052236 TaxID=3365686 RepID=UPI0037D58545